MSKIEIMLTVRVALEIGRCPRMDQMNVSITDQLAGFVRRKVKSGRYNNASEVVWEALRRMQDEDARVLRLARPSAEDILPDLTQEQVDGIRRRARSGIASVECGEYAEYEGRAGLQRLADFRRTPSATSTRSSHIGHEQV